MRRYVAELVGTFFLVLTIGCSVALRVQLAPVAIGIVLASMVFAAGHISGAHFNPAVSLAVHLRGRLDRGDLLPYAAAQLGGAVLAAAVVRVVVPGSAASLAAFSGRQLVAALLVEGLFTFALAYTVLNVATSKDTDGNSYYGFAIGGVVLAGAAAVGSVSGGMFNPAVALGTALMGLSAWTNLWVFLLANLGGGAAAAYAFRYLHPADR